MARAARLFGVAFGLIACRASEPAPASEERALRSQPASTLASASPSTSTPAACGEPGMAECPTQHWMKATLQAYLRTRDYKRLEASFEQLAARAPQGYDRWQEMAQSGARAAARQDEDRVRKACQHCHDQHRATFRRELRSAQLW